MDREGFLETIRKQYAEDIHEAYIECEQGDSRAIDLPKLNEKLNKLMRQAKFDGLPPKDFEDLVSSVLPDIIGKVSFEPLKKAA